MKSRVNIETELAPLREQVLFVEWQKAVRLNPEARFVPQVKLGQSVLLIHIRVRMQTWPRVNIAKIQIMLKVPSGRKNNGTVKTVARAKLGSYEQFRKHSRKCGTSKDKKNPDRCLPAAKARSLSKSERAATARKKKKAGSKG